MDMVLVIVIVIVVLLFLSLFISFRLWVRNANLLKRIRDFETDSIKTIPLGLDETGALTPGAKQAVRDYMLSIFAVGGTIGAIIAGVAGYMINDLAKETALTSALTEMQKPVIDGIQKLNKANSEVEDLRKSVVGLTKIVEKEKFVKSVVEKLAKNDNLRERIQTELVTQVAATLASKYSDKLRGPPVKDGVSPTASEVAAILVNKYPDKLIEQLAKPSPVE